MYLIEEVFVSDELLERAFCCDVSLCKGACCIEGDLGAPLEREELDALEAGVEKIFAFLERAHVERIQRYGIYTKAGDGGYATALMPDGACVFVRRGGDGCLSCAIETAHREGVIDFQKPLSCHLYPIRVVRDGKTGFEAINYDEWEICKPAIVRGKAEGLSVIRFLRDAIVRAYGAEFYDTLLALSERD